MLLTNCSTRKRPLLVALAMNLVGGVLVGFLAHLPNVVGVRLACMGRFVSGVGSGVAQVVGSAMLAELPPIRLRGTVLATLVRGFFSNHFLIFFVDFRQFGRVWASCRA